MKKFDRIWEGAIVKAVRFRLGDDVKKMSGEEIIGKEEKERIVDELMGEVGIRPARKIKLSPEQISAIEEENKRIRKEAAEGVEEASMMSKTELIKKVVRQEHTIKAYSDAIMYDHDA